MSCGPRNELLAEHRESYDAENENNRQRDGEMQRRLSLVRVRGGTERLRDHMTQFTHVHVASPYEVFHTLAIRARSYQLNTCVY